VRSAFRPARNPAEPRLVLNRYQLVERLGQGGMAEVYLAKVRTFAGVHKTVVVKRISPMLAENPEFVEMFIDEARIALRLDHPNIVHVFDVDQAEGEIFYVMEHLRGRDLREVVRQSARSGIAVPMECALMLVVDVCAGLHHAHELRGDAGERLGIVHRDLSPHNIFVTFEGAVKIIDFGIAKAEDRLSEGTDTGLVKGKLGYMSPEQCLAQHLDRRSDVFSLGVVLYELSTGVRLFEGRSDYEATKKLVELPIPPPSNHRQGYPAELERIVMRALERDRERRYPSAEALQADLEGFAASHQLPLSSPGVARFMRQLFGEADGKQDASSIVSRADGARIGPAHGDTATTSTMTPSHAPRRRRNWLALALPLVLVGVAVFVVGRMTSAGPTALAASFSDALPVVQIPSEPEALRPSVETQTELPAPRAPARRATAPVRRPVAPKKPAPPAPKKPDLDAPLP
jgi:serine/threonine protein kinase